MKNDKGEVVKSTIGYSPEYYLHGSGIIDPSYEAQFEGLKVGDSKSIYLKRENIAGENFTLNVFIDSLRFASKDEIMLGYPIIDIASVCDSGCACYDNG